ncbi:MAG: hypothetical protein ACK4RK_10915 [Gemmataceae bacterium]
MQRGPLSPREMGLYMSLAQVGLEMVVPVGIGIALDYYLSWTPWGVVVGAVLGLVVGIVHLIAITNRYNHDGSNQPRQDSR